MVEPKNDPATRLEAVFFLSQQPHSSRKLAQLAGLADGTKARTLVRSLNRRYDAEGSAFRIEEVAGGFQLMTRRKFAPWLRRLHAATAEMRLSPPAMETLAVVAYRQPVLRAEVEAIRGVQSGEVLRQLIERGLVRIAGRSKELGRPFLYGTTKQFMQIFGLKTLEELPRAERLRASPTDTTSTNNSPNLSNPSQVAEEETNVRTLIRTKPRQDARAEGFCATATHPGLEDCPGVPGAFAKLDEEEDDFEDDEDDLDDDEDDEEDDLDDEWEEVDDDDEEFDDEDDDDDWDDDEDFEEDDLDDDDDDWDDEDEDEEDDEEV